MEKEYPQVKYQKAENTLFMVGMVYGDIRIIQILRATVQLLADKALFVGTCGTFVAKHI